MYIQPEREPKEPIEIPENYSGNAFQTGEQEPPLAKKQTPNEAPRDEEAQAAAPTKQESVAAGAPEAEKPQGLRGRFPLLSSLLPPARGEHKKGGLLPEWALIGAVILLFLWEDEENDILPFLLLLLLWS